MIEDITATLNSKIHELQKHRQHEAINTEILKYIYYHIPSADIDEDIYNEMVATVSGKDNYETYESIADLKDEILKGYPEVKADKIHKDYEYQKVIITIDNLMEKIQYPDSTAAIDDDNEDILNKLSDVISIKHTPQLMDYADIKPYVYNEAILSEVKKDMDIRCQLAKENGDINYIDEDRINELENMITDTTADNDEKLNEDKTELSDLKKQRAEAKKQYKQFLKNEYANIQDKLYFIMPNPSSNLTFLVYEAFEVNYFIEYDRSKRTSKILKNQYNQFENTFKSLYPFDKFIKGLDTYEEPERTSYNILFKDGYLFNFDELIISSEIDKLPSAKSDLTYDGKLLTNEQINILDTCFNYMYPSKRKFKQFLLYVLCNFNKYHIKQHNFINIDDSGVGKTARILAMLELGFNSNADSNVLKKSELYNVANYNMLIVNEADKDKINGSILSDLCDSTPKDYTVKNQNTMRVKAKDKPLLTIIGENLPFFEQFNTGTERRLLLIPEVSASFKFRTKDKINIDKGIITDPQKIRECNYNELKEFYTILYNNPMETIQYYLMKIKEYNIIDEATAIADDMMVTIEDLSKLLTTSEDVFNKFFKAEPTAKDDETVTDRIILIGKNQSLNNLLNLINKEHIKTDKFKNTAEAKKSLNSWLKEINEIKNIKDYGHTQITYEKGKSEEAYYIYQLTDYAKSVIDKYNENAKEYDKIHYVIRVKEDTT